MHQILKSLKNVIMFFFPSEIDKIGVLDSTGIDNAYNLGYEQAILEMAKIKKALL